MVNAADVLIAIGDMLGLIKQRVDCIDLDPDDIHRILVIRLAYIGDVVMTLPVIEPLRVRFPDAKIDFLTSTYAAPLVRYHPHINDVIPFDARWFYPGSTHKTRDLVKTLRDRRYHLGIDFRGDIRNIYHCLHRPRIPRIMSYNSGGGGRLLTHPVPWNKLKHKIEFHLDILRFYTIPAETTCPEIHVPEDTLNSIRERYPEIFDETLKWIGIHPGARLPLKRWPGSCFATLIRSIRENSAAKTVLFGTGGEKAFTDRIKMEVEPDLDLSEKLNILEFAAVASRLDCIVCNDSAPMHIAAATGTKVVALFGPSRSVETAPCGDGHAILETQCDFKNMCDESNCIAPGKNGCMQQISVGDVVAKLEKILSV